MTLSGALPLLILIVKNRRILIDRDDVCIRELGLRVPGRLQVLDVDVILRPAIPKRPGGSEVASGTDSVRFPNAPDFVGRLHGAIEVEPVDESLRVYLREA